MNDMFTNETVHKVIPIKYTNRLGRNFKQQTKKIGTANIVCNSIILREKIGISRKNTYKDSSTKKGTIRFFILSK